MTEHTVPGTSDARHDEAGAWLTCLSCGRDQPLGPFFWGCPHCTAGSGSGTLEVRYGQALAGAAWEARSAAATVRGQTTLWERPGLLPPVGREHQRTLGEGNTPLLRLERLSDAAGFDDLYLKNEAANPTWAHKDRFHAVAMAMAAQLGYDRVVSSSTGNHGASMAAYAALHGLRSLVVCHEATPPLLTDLMRAYGATVVQTDDAGRSALLRALVAEHGWYPATMATPLSTANPFGVEGYKTIAYEIVEELGRAAPAHVVTSTAGGDGLYGIWKGMTELRAAGRAQRLPRLHSCQPANVAPLVHAFEQGLAEIVELPTAYSRALSIADPIGGSHALEAVRTSGGSGIAVTEDEILAAQRLLFSCGLAPESASAAALAGTLRLIDGARGKLEGPVVCVLTSTAVKWPPAVAEVAGLATGALLRGHLDVARLADLL
jgi:threonine synthase